MWENSETAPSEQRELTTYCRLISSFAASTRRIGLDPGQKTSSTSLQLLLYDVQLAGFNILEYSTDRFESISI